MKKILLSVLMVVFCGSLLAQSAAFEKQADVFIPRTLTAGTSMSLRVAATTYDDTTQAFKTRGFASVFIGVEGSANDSASPILVAYQVSKDNITFGPLAVLDSANFLTVVGDAKYFQLPAKAMGAYSVRARIYGRVGGDYSAGTTTKITTKIIRKHY